MKTPASKTTKITRTQLNQIVLESVNKILKESENSNSVYFTNGKVIVEFYKSYGDWGEGKVWLVNDLENPLSYSDIKHYLGYWGDTIHKNLKTPDILKNYLQKNYPDFNWKQTKFPDSE